MEPLVNFPVERDLVVDMEGFMDKLQDVKPYIIRDDVNDTSQGEYRQSPAELAQYKQYSMCINCMLCYAACPVVGHEDEFLGPAALALGHRYNKDSRDQGQSERLDVMLSSEAMWGCTFVGECSVVCPEARRPGRRDPAGQGRWAPRSTSSASSCRRGRDEQAHERPVPPAPQPGVVHGAPRLHPLHDP